MWLSHASFGTYIHKMDHLFWNDMPPLRHSCILIIVAWINTTQKPSLFTLIYILKWMHFIVFEYFLHSAKIQSHIDRNAYKKQFSHLHICILTSSAIAFCMRQEAVWHCKAIDFSQAIAKGYIVSHIMVILMDSYEHAPHDRTFLLNCCFSFPLRLCKLQWHLQRIVFIQLNEICNLRWWMKTG